jgi:hypothetical protein
MRHRIHKKVVVMALGGPVRVVNAQGVAVAWVKAGRTLQLETQANGGAPVASTLTGCLQKLDGHYFLVDQTTAVKVELKGPGLDGQVANQVTITGISDASATVASDASQMIDATSVTQISTHCVVPTEGTAPAGAGNSAKAAAHFSATKAVIAGVAVAGGTASAAGGHPCLAASQTTSQSIPKCACMRMLRNPMIWASPTLWLLSSQDSWRFAPKPVQRTWTDRVLIGCCAF